MSKKKLIIFIIVFILGFLVFTRFLNPEDTWLCKDGIWIKHGNPSSLMPATSTCNSDKNVQIVGGDKDTHGCIGSAGYSWCEGLNKCVRVWEEPCTAEDSLRNYLKDNISQLSPEKEVLGGKFYVTKISVITVDTAKVEYEDGHIVLKAKFNFSIKDDGVVDITNFLIIK